MSTAIGALKCVVIDVVDLERGEQFWSTLTGLPVRFSRVGSRRRYSRLGEGPASLVLQEVGEAASSTANSVHVDIAVDDLDSAVEQAVAIGATVRRQRDTDHDAPSRTHWAVLTDPFGNVFCLVE